MSSLFPTAPHWRWSHLQHPQACWYPSEIRGSGLQEWVNLANSATGLSIRMDVEFEVNTVDSVTFTVKN